MTTQISDEALLDIGFLIGYFKKAIVSKAIEDEDEGLWLLLERIDDLAVAGQLAESVPAEVTRRSLIESAGELKGRVWHAPIAQAASDALNRFCRSVARHHITADEDADCLNPPEPRGENLSDHQREQLTTAAVAGSDATSSAFATQIGAPAEGATAFWHHLCGDPHAVVQGEPDGVQDGARPEDPVPGQEPEQPDTATVDPEPPAPEPAVFNAFNPNGKRGRREWTPERRAAQAARIREHHKNKPPLVPDSALDDVRADWEAGLSFAAIGRKHGCSDAHIRKFLSGHGIDPRRGRPRGREADPSPPACEPLDSVSAAQHAEPAEPAVGDVPVGPDVFDTFADEADDGPRPDSPPERLIEAHRGYAGRRDPGQELHDNDWADIKTMLERDRRSVSQVASDYDVDWEVMRAFIDRKEAGEAPPAGEPPAPPR